MAFTPQPNVKPSWLDRIEFIGRYVLSGCEAPAGVYAEAALPAAANIIPLFLGLSVDDFVKEMFRPKGLRSKRHGRKGRKSGRGPRGIPDPNELAGRGVSAELGLADRSYGVPTRAFYVISDGIDRIDWTVALVEAADELVYTTLLGVLQHQGNQCPNLRRLWRQGGHAVNGGVGPQWQPISGGALKYAVGISSPIGSLLFLPEGRFSITLGLKASAPNGQVDVEIIMSEAGNRSNRFASSGWLNIPKPGTTDFLLNCQVRGPVGVAIEAQHSGEFWDTENCDLMVLEIL